MTADCTGSSEFESLARLDSVAPEVATSHARVAETLSSLSAGRAIHGRDVHHESAATAFAQWRSRHAAHILGSHPKLLNVFQTVQKVADTDCSVLVAGESGTGKELVARLLHTASTRSSRPFCTVNCAAIPENLLESELFGHARGSFSGATQSRVGRFSAADGGTLFLDEIGELPLSLQSKLLRVLQDKEVTPVGENIGHHVDVRVVTATNRDLEAMVESGEFREDLLYRLNVIHVEMPALRQRGSDLQMLVTAFIERINARRNRRISGITDAAMQVLARYPWPGNIRQLENTLERMIILRSEGVLDIEDCPRKIIEGGEAGVSTDAGPAPRHHNGGNPNLPEDGIDLRDAVERFENSLILQALERSGWNKNRAASILRMNRTTLVEKLKKKSFMRSPETSN